MRGLKGVLVPLMILVAAFVFIAALTEPASAEEPAVVNSFFDEGKQFGTYNEYHYPSGNRMFYLPRRHEVKFDIHNGKFFQIRYWPHHYNTITGATEEADSDYKVYFYTPTGQLFAIRRIKFLDYGRYHSIPHNDRSSNYERLIIKIQNNTEYNKDFVFKVLDPVDPVQGTPIKGAQYRMILLD